MIMIAIRSSTTANVNRNTRRAPGRCDPTRARTATAKAISVAVGIAHPLLSSGEPATTIMKIPAGTITPPTAATTGISAVLNLRRSPATNSRLSSRPTRKKKMASRPSAAQAPRLRRRCNDSNPISKSRREK